MGLCRKDTALAFAVSFALNVLLMKNGACRSTLFSVAFVTVFLALKALLRI